MKKSVFMVAIIAMPLWCMEKQIPDIVIEPKKESAPITVFRNAEQRCIYACKMAEDNLHTSVVKYDYSDTYVVSAAFYDLEKNTFSSIDPESWTVIDLKNSIDRFAVQMKKNNHDK